MRIKTKYGSVSKIPIGVLIILCLIFLHSCSLEKSSHFGWYAWNRFNDCHMEHIKNSLKKVYAGFSSSLSDTKCNKKLSTLPDEVTGARVYKYLVKGAQKGFIHIRQVHLSRFETKKIDDRFIESEYYLSILGCQKRIEKVLCVLTDNNFIVSCGLEGKPWDVVKNPPPVYDTMNDYYLDYGPAYKLASEGKMSLFGADSSCMARLDYYTSLNNTITTSRSHEELLFGVEEWKRKWAPKNVGPGPMPFTEEDIFDQALTVVDFYLFTRREDYLISKILTKINEPVIAVIYGAAHDFRDNVLAFNQDNPESKFSLVVIDAIDPEDKLSL